MNTDSIFTIGSTHAICQDYTTHFRDENQALIIVSDGCSSSSKTDVGSRLLAETFANLVRTLSHPNDKKVLVDFPLTLLKAHTLSVNNHLRLPSSCFDSTLLACFAEKSTQLATLFIWGDGHLRIQHVNGEITTLDVDFLNNQNAPFYPSYHIFNPTGREDYETHFGPLTPTRVWTSNILPTPEFSLDYPVFQIPLEGIASLTLFSDGASSFLKGENNEPVTTEEITNQLCDFKSLEGDFLKRRVRKCQKLWRKEQIQHSDDLGIASIIFPPQS